MPGGEEPNISVDVYAVLKAFKVDCPATAHAIKKLLCAGQRDKGDRLADLKGAMAALNRAIDMDLKGNPPPPLHNQVMAGGFFVQFKEGDAIPGVGSTFPVIMFGNTVMVKALSFRPETNQVEVEIVDCHTQGHNHLQ